MLPGEVAKTQVCSVSNHETTSRNLMSRYLRLETPVHMCVLQKRVAKEVILFT